MKQIVSFSLSENFLKLILCNGKFFVLMGLLIIL